MAASLAWSSRRVALRSEMSAIAVSSIISNGVDAVLATGQVQLISPTVRKRTSNTSLTSFGNLGVNGVTGTNKPFRRTTSRLWL